MKISSKTGPCAMVPTWIIGRVSGRALEVFIVLAGEVVNYSTDEGEISKAKLAERVGCSTSTIEAALRDLVAVGVVEKLVRKSENGSSLPNAYMIDVTRPENREGVGATGGEGVGDLVPPSLQRGKPSRVATSPDGELAPSRENLAPPTVKVEGRNLPFDALAEACGIREGSPRLRTIPVALNGPDGIRAQAWRELLELTNGNPPEGVDLEAVLAEGIKRRADLYRRALPGAELTPTALAKWWTDLPGRSDQRGMTGDDLRRLAADLRERSNG